MIIDAGVNERAFSLSISGDFIHGVPEVLGAFLSGYHLALHKFGSIELVSFMSLETGSEVLSRGKNGGGRVELLVHGNFRNVLTLVGVDQTVNFCASFFFGNLSLALDLSVPVLPVNGVELFVSLSVLRIFVVLELSVDLLFFTLPEISLVLLVVGLVLESVPMSLVGFCLNFIGLSIVFHGAKALLAAFIAKNESIGGLLISVVRFLLIVDDTVLFVTRLHFAKRVEVLLDVPKVRAPIVTVTSNGSSIFLKDNVLGVVIGSTIFSVHELSPMFGVGMVLMGDFLFVVQDLVVSSGSHASSQISATSTSF